MICDECEDASDEGGYIPVRTAKYGASKPQPPGSRVQIGHSYRRCTDGCGCRMTNQFQALREDGEDVDARGIETKEAPANPDPWMESWKKKQSGETLAE